MHTKVNFTNSDARGARTKLASWTIIVVVPAVFILKLLGLALYAIPESDDFCFFHAN
ncbi:hypothetical protein ABIB00_007855, partial [Bradyrhizobium sp. LB14.3]